MSISQKRYTSLIVSVQIDRSECRGNHEGAS